MNDVLCSVRMAVSVLRKAAGTAAPTDWLAQKMTTRPRLEPADLRPTGRLASPSPLARANNMHQTSLHPPTTWHCQVPPYRSRLFENNGKNAGYPAAFPPYHPHERPHRRRFRVGYYVSNGKSLRDCIYMCTLHCLKRRGETRKKKHSNTTQAVRTLYAYMCVACGRAVALIALRMMNTPGGP